jgi:hypothetical protein
MMMMMRADANGTCMEAEKLQMKLMWVGCKIENKPKATTKNRQTFAERY